MAKIKATTNNMITWKFKCLKCNHRFTAIEPQKLYDAYTKCTMCGSKDFEKNITKEGENFDNKKSNP